MMDRFGFLPCDWTFEFEGGEIRPIPEIDEVRKAVERYTNEDGFLYPPLSQRVRLDWQTDRVLGKIAGTERPAHLHQVPPSHELCLRAPGTIEEVRKGPGAFIMHLVAYLFGVRLQFHDWWFDSRVPIRMGQTHNTYPNKAVVEHFCLIVTECGKAGLPRSKDSSPTCFSCIRGLHPTSGIGSDLRLSTWCLMVVGS